MVAMIYSVNNVAGHHGWHAQWPPVAPFLPPSPPVQVLRRPPGNSRAPRCEAPCHLVKRHLLLTMGAGMSIAGDARVSRESFGQRMLNSFCGMLVGLVLF